ncbi:hypothetical protein MMC27_005257 [Xylographa pallens]|nr:hypothetical protein [Xylographa pallens]
MWQLVQRPCFEELTTEPAISVRRLNRFIPPQELSSHSPCQAFSPTRINSGKTPSRPDNTPSVPQGEQSHPHRPTSTLPNPQTLILHQLNHPRNASTPEPRPNAPSKPSSSSTPPPLHIHLTHLPTMLRRAPTAITLTPEDIAAYEDSRLARLARLAQQAHASRENTAASEASASGRRQSQSRTGGPDPSDELRPLPGEKARVVRVGEGRTRTERIMG